MLIQAGAEAPEFMLQDQDENEVRLSELLAHGPVALVFFPLAFSGICTEELCELRDNLAVFEDSRVQIVGLSVDSPFALNAWSEREGYRFPILSDFWPHGGVAAEFGAFLDDEGIATRATVLIGDDRRVIASFSTAPDQPRDLAAYRAALGLL